MSFFEIVLQAWSKLLLGLLDCQVNSNDGSTESTMTARALFLLEANFCAASAVPSGAISVPFTNDHKPSLIRAMWH